VFVFIQLIFKVLLFYYVLLEGWVLIRPTEGQAKFKQPKNRDNSFEKIPATTNAV
jgi:hypothetical protein